MELVLSPKDRIVLVQFNFERNSVLPTALPRIADEGLDDRVTRKAHPPGGNAVVLPPTEMVDVSDLAVSLFDRFVMVQAWAQRRLKRQDVVVGARTSGARTYHTVRFTFCRAAQVHKVDIADEAFPQISAAYCQLLFEAFWRLRVFRNQDTRHHPGNTWVSINLEARAPLYRADGSSVQVWERDANGRRLGHQPQPLAAADKLVVVSN